MVTHVHGKINNNLNMKYNFLHYCIFIFHVESMGKGLLSFTSHFYKGFVIIYHCFPFFSFSLSARCSITFFLLIFLLCCNLFHFVLLIYVCVCYRSNKKYFEVYTIVTIIQELLRNCGNENAFLALNLKSILFNLNSAS